jgi:endonuclease YncB( thermonuclease family)
LNRIVPLFGIAVVLAALASCPAMVAQPQPLPAPVAWVEPPATLTPIPFVCATPRAIDGDTLHCADGTRVRVRGVDTPERGEPGWGAARDELQQRVTVGAAVVVPRHLSYGRIVGDVWVGGENVGWAMDRDGWSKPVGARR